MFRSDTVDRRRNSRAPQGLDDVLHPRRTELPARYILIDAPFTVGCVSAHLIATPGGTTSGSQRCPIRRLVKVTRRKHLHQLGAAFLAPCGTAAFSPLIAAQATPPAWRQGVSLFGDLKYPAGFPRFDYASSSAPTGGRVRQGALGSYDNFNMVTEGARGNLAIGIELIYDTLLLPSMDEAASAYGLLAEAVAIPAIFLGCDIVCAQRQDGMTAPLGCHVFLRGVQKVQSAASLLL